MKMFNYRKDEAANRPKMNFVPKTLADLNVDTISSSDGMNGGNFSLHGKTHITDNKNTDLGARYLIVFVLLAPTGKIGYSIFYITHSIPL